MQRHRFLPMLLTAAATAFGQSDVIQLRVPGPGEPVEPSTITLGTGEMPRLPGARLSTFEFVRNEFGPATLVKGAPYTAEANTETIQVLADGNRIVRRDSSTLARDTQGRTRRDVTLPMLPGMSAGDVPKFSFIFDPVANASYTLDHNARTVRKSAGQGVVFGMSRKAMTLGNRPAIPGEVNIVRERVPASASHGAKESAANGPGAKTEDLGKQDMEGVLVVGTRTTTTIPAGQIGNERPIEVVSERWYSPELQAVVMSRHIDPRQGETIYKLTNLRRGEPSPSLFEVPGDYAAQAAGESAVEIHQILPAPSAPPAPKQ